DALRLRFRHGPAGWDEGDFAEILAELKDGMEEMADDLAEVRSDFAEMRSDFAEMRSDFAEMRSDFAEMQDDFDEFLADMEEDFKRRAPGAPARTGGLSIPTDRTETSPMKNVEDFYPLSPMQQGMLFASLMAPESGVYVEQMSVTLRGDLDVDAFRRAWQTVVDRYAILRTAFTGEGLKEPVQLVLKQVQVPFTVVDWRDLPPAEQEAKLAAYLEAQRHKGFVLSRAPLLRLALMRIADDAHIFVMLHHHILLDGWSVPILLGEV